MWQRRRGKRGSKRPLPELGRYSIRRDSEEEEEEEEDAAPAPKAQKLMGDAIRAGAVPSKPKTAPKAAALAPKPKPKRSTKNIPAEEKNKAPLPEAEMEEEDDESHVLRKLKPKIPDHNDAHPVAENMKIRKDSGLRPEHLLKSLWDLNPKRLLQKGRRGRRGSKRPLLECLGGPQS